MIEITGLIKKYGERTVVDNLSLSIKQGELFGLLGPNGAGKTTTIRILTMLAKSTGGKISINGWEIPGKEEDIKKIIGVVPQHLNLDIELTAWENLELHGRLHQIPPEKRRQKIAELLEFVELSERRDDIVQVFSGGMKRRLMIARALLHEPKVLFLDEPTVGLDPQVRRRLWELVKELSLQGMTVLLTTHYIEEAEFLCHRTAILDKGKLIALDTPQNMCSALGEYIVEWQADGVTKNKFFPDKKRASLFLSSLPEAALVRQINLEDVFVEHTGRKVRE